MLNFGEGERGAGNHEHRYGVGGVGEKVGLIDVEPDACDGAQNASAGEGMLDENATNFAIASGVDVVWPFYGDGGGGGEEFFESAYDGDGNYLRDSELCGRIDVGRLEQHG